MRKKSKQTKLIAWILTICLVITLIPDIGYAADDSAPEGLTEDRVVDKTETTTTFDIGDGRETVVFHGGAVRFENEEGELTDIDPSLVEIEEGEKTAGGEELSGYSFRNAQGERLIFMITVIRGSLMK